jgi:hypothetical protein
MRAIDLTLELEMTDFEASSLAQFVKRAGWVEYKNNAVDDTEAYAMADAMAKLQSALARAGYNPR